MVLYGLFADGVFAGNFSICKTRYDGFDNIQLPRSQSELRLGILAAIRAAARRRQICMKDFDEIGNAVLANPEFATENRANAFEKNLCWRVFEDNAPSTQLERLDDLFFRYGSGQQYRWDGIWRIP